MTPSSKDMCSPIGRLLREWRAARRMSQLDLALEADVSARHVSCIETGKSRASKDVIGRLADALGMPLRERNALIRAGGFATEFSETPLLSQTGAIVVTLSRATTQSTSGNFADTADASRFLQSCRQAHPR